MSNDVDIKLMADARSIVARVREAVRGKALWIPGIPKLHVLGQAVIIRQTECLESAIVLAEAGQGSSGLPFVRPACEELAWLKYLVQLESQDAEAMVEHFARRQMFESLRAQEEFVGSEEMIALGLAGMRERHETVVEENRAGLIALGLKLGWDKKATSKGRLPSTRFIADQAGETRLYKFIYGASSRHVHFNFAELMRRVWGRNGVFEIGSQPFSRYFTAFTLGWCSHLLVRTVLAAEPILPGTVSRFCSMLSANDLTPPALVPIVTADELSKGGQGKSDAG